MNIVYPAKITFDKTDQRYLVEFYDFEEAITEGETLEEALFNAAEVLTLTLEGRLDEQLEIPKPSKRTAKCVHFIAPSARVQAALLIRLNRGEHSISEIARTLDSSWPAISRLEDPHHWPSLRQLERTASAIGHRLVLSLEPISQQQR
jgi:antitoxin HicB